MYRPYFNKLNPPSTDFEIIDNGYHFSHFYDLETTINKIKILNDENSDYKLSEIDDRISYSYENLTSIKTNDYEKNYNLIEYNGDLPKNIHLLKNQEIGRTWSKKNLILFVNEDNFNSLDIEESFDNICVINFTSDTKLPYETQLSDKTTRYNILKPLNIFYQISEDIMDLEKFQKVFCTNDIKKIIYDLQLINHDLITFSNNHNPLFKSTYSWEDVRNKYIYDLVKDIL